MSAWPASIIKPAGMLSRWRNQESRRMSVSVWITPSFIDRGSASSLVTRSTKSSGGIGSRQMRRNVSSSSNSGPYTSEILPDAAASSWERVKITLAGEGFASIAVGRTCNWPLMN